MPLETRVDGDPGSVEALATWLAGTLSPAVSRSADVLAGVRSDAASDWQGEAGAAFARSTRTGAVEADDLAATATGAGAALTTYAAALRSAQGRMAAVRADAAAAGLAVSGTTVHEPGPAPVRPGPLVVGPDVPAPVVAEHEQAVARWDRHQQLVLAWNAAVVEAEDTRAGLAQAQVALEDKYRGLKGPQWALNGADMLVGSTLAALSTSSERALRGTAEEYRGQARAQAARARLNDPAVVSRDRFYADHDQARRLGSMADDFDARADVWSRRSSTMPMRFGGVLAVAGVGFDIADGKDPVQAVASGGGGFLASVGAGAAAGAVAGTFIPVPVAGTVIGAVVGTGIGIFTSGAIDSLFEDGPDVGRAAAAGRDAVMDTVGAVGSGVGSVVEGAGDLVGGWFD